MTRILLLALVLMLGYPAIEIAAKKAPNLPPQVYTQSVKADFVPLLPAIRVPSGRARATAVQSETVRLRIVEPADGAALGGPEIGFRLQADGNNLPLTDSQWTGDGAFRVQLDGVEVLQVTQLQFTMIGINPGKHLIEVDLQGWSGGKSNTARTNIEIIQTARPDDPRWNMALPVAAVVVVIFGGLLLLWLFWVRPQQMEPEYDDPDDSDARGDGGRQEPSGQTEG